jgi:hypothetical protein
VRDDQVRRYARHILLPDVGGLGQTALLRAEARVELRDASLAAELIAARYLAAGGVGTVVLAGATGAQLADVAACGPDTRVAAAGAGRDVPLPATPAWWPSAPGDDVAVAFWRGGVAATRWMAAITTR